ncbi:phenylalanine ammonia-lyase [Gyrodon lividus]|nr:phenylalanine ammonia-lyase [Gyrodon lividus]
MSKPSSLIAQYVADVHELDEYLSGKPITLTGSDLSLPQIVAIALYAPAPSTSHTTTSHPLPHAPPLHLTSSRDLRSKHAASRHVISSKVQAGLSVYGVSTGFGGSADTRTDDPIALGAALLQHQHAGILTPSSASPSASLSSAPMPLTDPTHSTTMPPPWTRAAMLIRTNSLLRGHSGVRWELVEKMVEVIQKGLVPLVPLRGSVSASGDLSSLSYIAGMLIGNPAIRVWMLSPPSLPSISIPISRLETRALRSFLRPVSTLTSTSVSRTTSPSGSANLSPISPSTPASSLPDEDVSKALPFSTASSQSPPAQISTYSAPTSFSSTFTAPKALALTHTTPLPLASKEHLGILNGTAFSAALAALVVNAASGVGVLGAVLTALSVEAMLGSRDSFDPFVGHARPHAGQIESAHLMWSLLSDSKFSQSEEVEVKIEEDQGVLRQDRYSLRTAPQWLGPQFEDMKRVWETIRIEVNSTTDNPLVEPPSEVGAEGKIHHAGNFQALSLTNAMDHLRLSLSHIGRLMFVQLTEIINPAMNRGLPGNLAGGEAALDFGCKGLDIAAASYAGELNALGGMNVGVGNVSAEMHNQSVNSLALISARYTLSALEVSQLLAATHLFVVCQALDCRALYVEMRDLSTQVVKEVLLEVFNFTEGVESITRKMMPHVQDALDRTTGMDTAPRMDKVAGEAVAPLLENITCLASSSSTTATDLRAFDLSKISTFRTTLARRLEMLLTELRCAYLGVELGDVRGGCMASSVSASSFGASSPSTATATSASSASTEASSLFNLTSRGPAPASHFLAPRTRILYEFVRKELCIGMHGADNLRGGVFGMRSGLSVGNDDLPGLLGVDEDTTAGLGEKVDTTVGDKVSIIVEAIRDGRMGRVLARVCEGIDI